MSLFKLLSNVNGTKAFPVFSPCKMQFAFATMLVRFFYLIEIPCIPNEWRLFIDCSSKSLKAVLLHNGKKHTSLLLAHSVHLKETYENVKTVLNVLKYDQYNWEVIGDFKIKAFFDGNADRFHEIC